jgi:histidine ammonia-lyase
VLILNGQSLTLEEIRNVSSGIERVDLDPDARGQMARSRATIDRIIEQGITTYGVNTGFGKLADVHIPEEDLKRLQLNLVRSHACGVGNPLSEMESTAMMLLRANTLALGFSGARPQVVELIVAMINRGICPLIPEKGSVGASGDLAPLAHLAMALIGEGECLWEGKRISAYHALEMAELRPLELEAKEGLALLNGTQAINAVGALALARAEIATRVADIAGAMSLEALLGTPVAFDTRIHDARPHAGQRAVAGHLRALLRDSEIRDSHIDGDSRVQDAYSLRCMPQVHGAVRDSLAHVRDAFELESGSATDNPLVFADTDDVLSGGNFHAAPLASKLDYAAIAMTDLMSISERRIDRLINPDINEHLPPFLTSHAGSCSGFMIPHVTAVALLNEAKVLSHPASIDNVPTSGGKEDHVSMGMTSALKFRTIVENAERVIAIELIAAAEGLEYRKPLRPGAGVEDAYNRVRGVVERLTDDRSLAVDIQRMADSLFLVDI